MIATVESNNDFTKNNNDKKHLVLLDGYGFIFRAYHSMPPLSRPDGVIVGALYGYANMLLKLMADMEFDYFAVILDHGSDSFRKNIYPEYKANRPPAPEDLIPQFALVREFTIKMNLPTIEAEGYEADDIIATYCKQAKAKNMDVTIISSDKDLMQLVSDNVKMYDPIKNKIIGEAEVIEKFAVPPSKIIDLLAMMGDSADNIPGIPSIGPKTAASLLDEYGSLDGVIANVDKIKQNKRKEVIRDNQEQAYLSRDLVVLYDMVEVERDIESFSLQRPDLHEMIEFLKRQNFKSMIPRMESLYKDLPLENINNPANNNHLESFSASSNIESSQLDLPLHEVNEESQDDDAEQINIVADIERVVSLDRVQEITDNILSKADQIAIYHDKAGHVFISTSGYNYHLSLSKKQTQNILLFPDDSDDDIAEFYDGDIYSWESVFQILRQTMLDKAIKKICYDLKAFLHLLAANNFAIQDILELSTISEDLMLISYLTNNGKSDHQLVDLLFEYLWIAEYEVQDELKSAYMLALYKLMSKTLHENRNNNLYYLTEKPLVPILFLMEKTGVIVSKDILKKLSDDFASGIASLEQEIFNLAEGIEFNIGSPKQLGEVLFDKLGIDAKVKKSKKTGNYSTSQEILEELSMAGFTIADKVLEWRHLSKLKSTYTDALAKQINPHTGRIHTTFNNAVTTTGRLSSTKPNLQNIPIRSKEGNKIREAFICTPGYKLISADYSQIELRVLAHIADIKSLKTSFTKNEDIHSRTASEIFGVEISQVTPDLRRKAKAINFGIIYKISNFGLARNLGISREEAKLYIDSYFARYPEIQAYMADIIENTKAKGYIETILKRRCYFKDINSSNYMVRSLAERAVVNAPIQGSAADIIKIAMVDIQKQFKKRNLQTKMLLQIHDELIFEAPESEVEIVSPLIQSLMQNVLQLTVPLVVDVRVGDNIAQIH